MHWYEADVRAVEYARKINPPPARPIAFYGSSSIRLWDTLSTDFPGAAIYNAGFGGSTLVACAWFFDRLILPVTPSSIVFYAGDNDLGDGRTPQQVLDSYSTLMDQIDRAFGPALPFVFISIKPSLARWNLTRQIREANARVADAVTRRPGGIYVNVFDAMLTPSGRPRGELFVEDGLHLSPAGYHVWRSALQLYRHRWDLAEVGER